MFKTSTRTIFVLLSTLILASHAFQTTPDLGTLANHDGDHTYYTTPVLTCHSNFNVTIEAGNWSLIAIEGYELERGNYGFNDGNDSMCVSRTPYADIHFDIQDHCHGGRKTMKVFNNTYTWTLRARAEWMIETQQDRLFPMKCEYTLTGEAIWDSVTKVVTQVFSTEAAVEATRNVIINGSKIHLVDDAAVAAAGQGLPGDQMWPRLDSVTVGKEVRLLIDTKDTGWHLEMPYVGVMGCWFYDRDPAGVDGANAMKFPLTDQHGCNKPPSYYDPFTAARTPGVNGMYMNEQPVDGWLTGASNQPANDPMQNGGYLSGADELGYAYSDVFKMFKFPGAGMVWAKCELRFCVESDDPRCITPNCAGRYYTSTYANGGYGQEFRRRKRSARSKRNADATPDPDTYTEDVITVIAVTSPGTTTKIGVNGPGDVLTLESGTTELSAECETKFYAVLAVTICLGLALLGILIVYLFKRAAGRISPVDKARFIEDHYGRPNSVPGGGMYGGGGGGGMRMNMMGGGGGGLPMISK
jgi:hypothetical protein